jgi:ATP-binding cassette subfamily F protein 3
MLSFYLYAKKEEKKPEPEKSQNGADNKHQQLKKFNQELAKLEEQAAVLEGEVIKLNEQLADKSIYSDTVKLKSTKTAHAQKQAELKQVQEKWEALAEQIMELEA